MARHNLGTVISFEVVRTLTKKQFWIATTVVPLLIGIVIALMVSANETTISQVDSQKNAKLTFTYSDASGYVDPAIVTAFGGSLATDEVRAIADVKSGKTDAYIAYPADPVERPTQVYGVDNGVFDNGKYAAVATQLLVESVKAKIGDQALTALTQGTFPVVSTTYRDGRESGGFNEVIPPLAFLVIFYVVIVLLGNQMVTSLLEEKENRVTEMILTTLDPTNLVVGKVVALFIVGVVQMLAFALPVVVGYLFFRDSLNLPNFDLSHLILNPGPMTVGALLLVGGFTLFTASLVAIGAVMPTAKDAGQIFAPLMILVFVPFYAISLVVSDPHSFIVQVFTYFPYTAPVTAMIRNALGSLSPTEAIIVIVELFALGFIVLRLAVRLFRYGSIEYSRKVSLRAVFVKK
jgi:ABC-2 type transport system permease protein